MKMLLMFYFVCLIFCGARGQSLLINEDVRRSVDISTQIVTVKHDIVLRNDGNLTVKKFEFHIEPDLIRSLSYIVASSGDFKLEVTEVRRNELENILFWNIHLKSVLKVGQRAKVQVLTAFTYVLIPYPTHISQGESQLVKYIGNAYFWSRYFTEKQTTFIVCSSDKFESFSTLERVSVHDNVITYGPYKYMSPFSVLKITVHYVNNEPFIAITNLERTIEVSHWGNIAVEETIELYHKGAILKGTFSRMDYEQFIRKSHKTDSSISSYVTVLPASAKDIYYRDEIGNVSSSHVRILDDSVHLMLKFRFPLFGGWKIRYTIGYNVPSYEYLYSNGEDYRLRMRVIDHVYDSMVVDEFITKVILPEHCENIWMHPPFSMVHLPEIRYFTYLDITGRPVVTVAKNNLVEFHIQDFEVWYTFPKYMMLMEPLLAIGAIYLVLIIFIIVNRVNFSIVNDEQPKIKSKCKSSKSGHHKEN